MLETIILISCGTAFILLSIILVWWLKVGKQHFIEKRCPERLQRENSEEKNDEKQQNN